MDDRRARDDLNEIHSAVDGKYRFSELGMGLIFQSAHSGRIW